MKASISFTAALCCLCFGGTDVYVISSVHSKTPSINVDTFITLFNRIRPDVILVELDTSLMDTAGRFRDSVLEKNEKTSLEMRLYKRYMQINRKVVFRPIDVANRNAYYLEHETFRKEGVFGGLLDSLAKANALDSFSTNVVDVWDKTDKVLKTLNNMDLRTINSVDYCRIMEFRQNWMYKEVLKILKRHEKLAAWQDFWKEDGDFWDLRNTTMCANVIRYAGQFPGKCIVVNIGAYHKYALKAFLSGRQKESNFILKEAW